MMEAAHLKLSSPCGYDPDFELAAAAADHLSLDEVLVVGSTVRSTWLGSAAVRQVLGADVQLPEGVYWFTSTEPACLLVVTDGAPPATPETSEDAPEGSALGASLNWFDQLWERGILVPPASFTDNAHVVLTGSGGEAIVKQREFKTGNWLYKVFVNGKVQRVRESALTPLPSLDEAKDWIQGLPSDPHRWAATLTRAKLEKSFTNTVFSFRATRTIFRPYQFKPVMKLLNAADLRLLVADEVGLGKTIEAGLVWTELEARRRADRVLIVCPSSLVAKWQREMAERFGFELTELTSELLTRTRDQLERDRLPRRGAYVCSLERLRTWDSLEHVSELGLDFNLVIVDEAHAFRNSETMSHKLGVHLSQWAEALVFLSATPVNLRNRDLLALLDLLVPGEFMDVEALEERLEPNRVLHRVSRSLLDENVTNKARSQWLDGLNELPYGRILMQSPTFNILRTELEQPDLNSSSIARVKRACAELHGLAAQVTRTRKVEVQEVKALRAPVQINVEWSESEHRFYEAFYAWCQARAAASGTPLHFSMQMPLRLAGSCLPAAAESVLRPERTPDLGYEESSSPGSDGTPASSPPAELIKAAKAISGDTKLSQFELYVTELLRLQRQALVFTFSRRTVRYLYTHISGTARVAMLHGGVPKEGRDRIMASFRSGEYDIVLATKVASEGLDFEFCSVVVNYDLPWNPMEVEQRIGRIDRIGQSESKIAVVNFTTPGTIESDIIERLHMRIGVFEHSIGELEPIISSQWATIANGVLDFSLSPAQMSLRAEEAGAALAEQQLGAEEIETAAPLLVSSDGVDVEGLEKSLESSGRYVGQRELALLISDWAESYGARCQQSGTTLILQGNDEIARQVHALAGNQRSRAEVEELASSMRSGAECYLSLEQEESRTGGVPLLAATHPLVSAAVATPGYRQSRYTHLALQRQSVTAPTGQYLVYLVVAAWDGVRPIREIWSSAVDLVSNESVDVVGEALLASVAESSFSPTTLAEPVDLPRSLRKAIDLVDERADEAEHTLIKEEEAFMATRELNLKQGHERRVAGLRKRIDTIVSKGTNLKMVRPFEAQLAKAEARNAHEREQLERPTPNLQIEELAVCLVEVV